MMSGHRRLAERVRSAARTFVEQAGSDPDFIGRYRADPIGVLRAVGMPEIAIADALRETGYAEPEVAGFIAGMPSLQGSLDVVADPAILAECGFTCLWTAGPPSGATTPGDHPG
jgi:hypothetical protein